MSSHVRCGNSQPAAASPRARDSHSRNEREKWGFTAYKMPVKVNA